MKKIINLILIAMLVLIPIRSTATEEGHTKTVQITAKPGYKVTDVIVNGESKGPLTSYTFSDVLSPQTLEVITEAIGYTVTFDANGGTGTMETQTFAGTPQKLKANEYTKTGYGFAGWATMPDGKVEFEDEEKILITKTTTLYAVWVIYGDANGNGQIETGDSTLIQQYVAGTTSTIDFLAADVNADGEIDLVDNSIVLNSLWENKYGPPTNTYNDNAVVYCNASGYASTPKFCKKGELVTLSCERLSASQWQTRIGWSTEIGGELVYKEGQKVTIVDDLILYEILAFYGDVTGDGNIDDTDFLSMSQYINGEKVEILEETADVNLDGKINIVDLELNKKYMSGSVEDLPYEGIAVYDENQIIELLDESGVITISEPEVAEGYLTPVGYFVNNWGGKYVEIGDSLSISQNTKLIPVYSFGSSGATTPTPFVITFNANGGEGTMAQQAFSGSEAQNLTANGFTRDYYNFLGWSTTSDGAVEYVDQAVYTDSGDITLYAIWERGTAVANITNLSAGAYVKYTPSKTSCSVLTTSSGYSSTQSYNPSSTTSWKIFKNTSGQIDIISAGSIGNLTLTGEVGFRRLVETLNNLSAEYVNPRYATSGRSLGCTSASVGYLDPNTYTLSYDEWEGDEFPIVDTLYETDKAIIDATTSLRASTRVWLASRHNRNGVADYGGNTMMANGTVPSDVNGDMYASCMHTNRWDSDVTYGVRPIVSLKTGLWVADGTGTSSDPYILCD